MYDQKIYMLFQSLQSDTVRITDIKDMKENEEGLPEHLRISVTCMPEKKSDIRIEVWLPKDTWNGDFIGVGNGGSAGFIPHSAMTDHLKMGFAVASTDLGTSAGRDCGIENPAVWKDFGHRATHLMTVIAKEAIYAYYRENVHNAYFTGGSTGGQQALSEAQRYPEDYDGILSIAPAFDRVNLHLSFLWDWLNLNAPGVEPITSAHERKIAQAFLDQYACPGERHASDPFFYRPDRIKPDRSFFEGLGFSVPQTDALMKVYDGPPFSESTLTPGSEFVPLGLTHRLEKENFAREYFYILRWVLGRDFDFTKFDFDSDASYVRNKLCRDLDAADSDLSAFKKRGGKLLLIHGTADPLIPMSASIRYFDLVQKKMGDTSDFFRFFLAPGMGHVSGGPGVQDIACGFPATPKDEKHNALFALRAWRETGAAPDKLYPVAFRNGDMSNAFVEDGMSWEREITPYHGGKTEGRQ